MARTTKRTSKTTRRRATPASRKSRAVPRVQPRGRAAPARRSAPKSGHRSMPHREVEDSFWRAVLRVRAVAIWMLGLEEYAVVDPLPSPRVRGLDGNYVQLDLLYLCSMIAGDSDEQARQRLQQMQNEGREEPLGCHYCNVELRVVQQPGRDGDQLYEHRVGMRHEHGRMCPLRSMQFISGATPPARGQLGGMGADDWHESPARVVWRGDLDADLAPAAVRDDPMGAIALLRLRNGHKLEHVHNALAKVLGGDWDRALTDRLLEAMQMDEELGIIAMREVRNWKEGKIMANGVAAVSPANLKAFYRAVDAIVRGVGDMTQLPTIRKVLREQAKHERELQAKHERELQAKHERELQAKLEREQQKLEQMLHEERIDGLLSTLAGRDMRLTVAQEKRLHAKPLAELPPLKLARQAKDVSDFARRAGLTNGRK